MAENSSTSVENRTNLGQLTSITKLDKTNYKDWKEDIEIELKLRGIHKAIQNEVDELIDLQARRILLETMDKDHRAQVRGYNSAKEIWDRLRLSYAEATAERKYRLLTKFFRYVKESSDSIDVHVGKLDGMRADLESMDFKIEEDVFLATVIGSLPSEYGNVMEAWELAAKSEQTKQNLIAKLLNKEADIKQNMASSEHVFAMRARQGDKFRRLSIEE